MINVRRARLGDGKPIRRMIFDVLCEYQVPADPDDSDADIMDFGNSKVPGVTHVVAEENGVLIGSAVLTPYDAHSIKLSKLFVKSGYRRKGVGRLLLDTSVKEARNGGYAQIFLTTRAVYREAVKLYESNGWLRGPDQPAPGPDRLYFLELCTDAKSGQRADAAHVG